MDQTVAFTVPAHADAIRRVASKPPLCPQRHTTTYRSAPVTMKKISRGKKANLLDDESNAVDIFGGNSSPEDLLAAALADAPAKPKKEKKEKRKPKNVESVPDAVNETSSEDEVVEEVPQKVKKKAKNKKAGIVADDSNAVDVFGGDVNPDELLAQALGTSESNGVSAAAPQKSKKKAKRKKGSVIDDDSNAVDVFGASVDADQLLDDAMGVSSSSKPADTGVSMKGTKREEMAAQEQPLDGELKTTASPDDDEDDDAIVLEPDFVPDAEVVTEFETFGDELADFTLDGRRKKLKKEKEKQVRTTAVDVKRSNMAMYGTGNQKYVSVRLEDISVTFRNTTILRGVTWSVQTGERVGLVGENGCGKTTQLKIIAGQLKPNEGEVVSASSRIKCSFLRQEFVDELDLTRTLREEFCTTFEKEYKALEEYKKVEDEVANAGSDMNKLEELLNKLEDCRVACEDLDAWNLETRIDKIMPSLGFVPDDKDKLVASFSGGWKVRIGLGKVLLQNPDLLLLDEPSNHLDNDSVEWLETFLQGCALPMVVVSHDREFLDRVATKIVEIEGCEAVSYPGNYSTFVKLKAERRKAWEGAYEKQQRFITEQRQYINRWRRTPARISQVKSRQRMLDRMESSGQLVRKPPHGGKPLVFRFPPAPRSSREVVIIDELTHGYEDDQLLFKESNLEIERGDRIAIIGPNGSGKSTLLRLITGLEKPQEGTVKCTELLNVEVAYYEQNQADALDLNLTVYETLRESASSDYRYEDLRALLGKFLFKGDAVDKKVSALSGGEKARLALAKIMLKPANLLVLDEPGNHLSISAKEMLEEALQNFDGTLIIVSHDRYLLSQVAQQIVAVENQELVLYDGDYRSYMEKDSELFARLRARFIPGVAEIKSAPKVEATSEAVEVVEKKTKRKKNYGGSGISSGRVKEMNAKRWKK